jgi:hypothetical protein
MKQNRNSYAFVERLFERNQSSVYGKLTHAAADLASVFKEEQDDD